MICTYCTGHVVVIYICDVIPPLSYYVHFVVAMWLLYIYIMLCQLCYAMYILLWPYGCYIYILCYIRTVVAMWLLYILCFASFAMLCTYCIGHVVVIYIMLCQLCFTMYIL